MITAYGVPLSPFVRKARLALAEKKLDYKLVPVVPMAPHNNTPEYLEISPLGKVPALRDGDFSISDSSVILQYLDRKYPSPRLLPEAPEAYARAIWFEELADTKIIEAIGPVFRNRILKPQMMKQEPDEAEIQAGLEALVPLFHYVESQLEGDFLVGDEFTVADLAMGAMLRQFEIAEDRVDPSRWPKLAEHYERMKQRASFESVIGTETEFMRSMASP